MKKTILLAMILALAPVVGKAQSAFDYIFKCSVTQVQGEFGSYLPPHIGDVTQIDIRQKEFEGVLFESHNMIPTIVPLIKESSPLVASYRAHYKTPDGDQSITTLQIKQLANGRFQGIIKKNAKDNNDPNWISSKAILRCKTN